MRTKRKFGIARRFPTIREVIKPRLSSLLNHAVGKFTRLIIKKDWDYPDFLIKFFLKTTCSESRKIAEYSRKIAEALLPTNPLRMDESLPEISVMIPVISKDFSTIDVVLMSIIENTMNPISCITVVYAGDRPRVPFLQNIEVRTLPEMSLIPGKVEEEIQRYPKERQGWVRQQILKFIVAGNNDCDATLICDSDTILMEKRVWLNSQGIQQLQISHEYHTEYEKHFTKSFGEMSIRSRKISFITHHQLMQKSVIHEMFGKDMSRLVRWLACGNVEEKSPISEYHSYGRFLSSRYPKKCRLARWNNLFVDVSEQGIESAIRLHFENFSSLSGHRY
jgi:hypothetical protein